MNARLLQVVPPDKIALGPEREERVGDQLLVVRDIVAPAEPFPPYEERVKVALDAVAPLPVIVKEILLAMNHAQLSGQVNWSSQMDAIINRALPKLAGIRPPPEPVE